MPTLASQIYGKTIIRLGMIDGKLDTIYFDDGSYLSLFARGSDTMKYVQGTFVESQAPKRK